MNEMRSRRSFFDSRERRRPLPSREQRMNAMQMRGMAGSVLSLGAGTTTMRMPSSSPRCGDGSCFARKLLHRPPGPSSPRPTAGGQWNGMWSWCSFCWLPRRRPLPLREQRMNAMQTRGMAGPLLSSEAGTMTMPMPSSSPRRGDGSCFLRKLLRQHPAADHGRAMERDGVSALIF